MYRARRYLVNSSGLFLGKNTLQPLATDGFGNLTGERTRNLFTRCPASRETRGNSISSPTNGTKRRELWRGTSVSPTIRPLGQHRRRFDFNQKLTTLNVGLSYTKSSNEATLDHDAAPYLFNSCGTASCNFVSSTSYIESLEGGKKVLHGDRTDWGGLVGLTQVVNKNAQVSGNLGYTHSRGYLSNPYKVVEIAFVDPEQQFLSPSPDVLYVNVNSILEKRPDTRNQWQLDMRYAQYIDAADAALHLNYGYFRDWGIRHTRLPSGCSRLRMLTVTPLATTRSRPPLLRTVFVTNCLW